MARKPKSVDAADENQQHPAVNQGRIAEVRRSLEDRNMTIPANEAARSDVPPDLLADLKTRTKPVAQHREGKTPVTMHLEDDLVDELRLISKILIQLYGRDGHTMEALVSQGLNAILPERREFIDRLDDAGLLQTGSRLNPHLIAWKNRRKAAGR